MYSYSWDAETGGLLLNSSPLSYSKEPRPVYYKELDILGFDKYWNYEKDDAYPYLWAEANNYYYRGRLVAKIKGGSLYSAPELIIVEEPEPNNLPLRFVDIAAMTDKNNSIIEKLAQDTIKKVYNTYMEYRSKIDVFYVAFSGGKDSVVLLDIVQRALPHNEFKVLFGDTGMEFPDTYKTVEEIAEICRDKGIDFIIARSELDPLISWEKFGPPATVSRWCCSVHKTAPQVLALRRHMNDSNFTGMAFIGVRASESASRSRYDYISLGEKHKGQYSCNPIFEWNSAELYLYFYAQNLILNETYKKGNRRAGCLVCPRATERNDWMSRVWYKKEFDEYLSIIRRLYKDSFSSEKKLDEFIGNGGWKARKNGRDISVELNYFEILSADKPGLKITKPKTSWKEWIKTIGVLLNGQSPYTILFRNEPLTFTVEESDDEINVFYDIDLTKTHPLFIRLLKNVFKKSACCVNCKQCEAECQNGFIKMSNGQVQIDKRCVHCLQCHNVDKGCLVYKSLEMPKGGLGLSKQKSLNCYSHHAPRMDWFVQFFSYKNEFDQRHTLGSQMFSFFKRFLRDAQLLDKNGFSMLAYKIDELSLQNLSGWAIMLVNLAYTPQIKWLIKRITMNESFSREYVTSMLVSDGAKESWANDIWSSFGRLLELPFSQVGLGEPTKEKNKFVSMSRIPWQNPDPLIILYSLYKFAENCGGYYQFTLRRLLDHSIESDGVSPTEVFGLDRETMEKLLNGLTANHPNFINVSFTLDLDTITLNEDKTSSDVLELL
jgi:phosphoadenosine phosphosulfate reductase